MAGHAHVVHGMAWPSRAGWPRKSRFSRLKGLPLWRAWDSLGRPGATLGVLWRRGRGWRHSRLRRDETERGRLHGPTPARYLASPCAAGGRAAYRAGHSGSGGGRGRTALKRARDEQADRMRRDPLIRLQTDWMQAGVTGSGPSVPKTGPRTGQVRAAGAQGASTRKGPFFGRRSVS